MSRKKNGKQKINKSHINDSRKARSYGFNGSGAVRRMTDNSMTVRIETLIFTEVHYIGHNSKFTFAPNAAAIYLWWKVSG